MTQLDALRFALSTIDQNSDAYEVIAGMIDTREKAAARPKKPSKSSLHNAELIRDIVVPFVNEHGITTAKTLANECGNAEISGDADYYGNYNSAKAASLLKRAANEGLIVSFKESKNSVTLYATLDYDVDAHLDRVWRERAERERERAEKAAAKAAEKAKKAQELADQLATELNAS